MKMAFGDVLRNLLGDIGLTQKELATKLNIAPSTLGNYIQNSREPDFETLKQIADHFNVSVDYLLEHPSADVDTVEEERLLCVYRAMTSEQREIFLEQGKTVIKVNSRKK